MNVTRAQLLAGFNPRSVRDGGILAAVAALLGVVGGLPLLAAILVPAVAVVVSLVVRGTPSPAAQEYGLLPALVALGVLAVLSVPSFLAGVLAGLGGLALLLWNADTPQDARRGIDPVDGLLLPGVGLAVALLAAIALPAANAAVGLAALAIVVAFALVLWALGRAVGPAAAGEAL